MRMQSKTKYVTNKRADKRSHFVYAMVILGDKAHLLDYSNQTLQNLCNEIEN